VALKGLHIIVKGFSSTTGEQKDLEGMAFLLSFGLC